MDKKKKNICKYFLTIFTSLVLFIIFMTSISSVSVQENAAQTSLIPYLSNLDISEEMEDQEPLPEEQEELIVLDSENVCSFSFHINAISYNEITTVCLNVSQKEKWNQCFIYVSIVITC